MTIKELVKKQYANYKLGCRKILFFYKSVSTHSRIILLSKIIIPLVILIIIFSLIFIPQFNTEIKKIKIAFPNIKTLSNISYSITNGELRGRGDNGINFSIKVGKFTENQFKNFLEFLAVSGSVITSNGKRVLFKTDAGNLEKKQNIFSMSGNVEIVDEQNTILAQEAIIDFNNMNIKGDKSITILFKNGNVKGDSFSFENNKLYTITGHIHATIDLK